MTKTCSKCNTDKDRAEFYVKECNTDGLYSICKACSTKKTVRWQRENPKRSAAIQKRYRDNNKEKCRLDDKAYRDKHPKRRNAYDVVWYNTRVAKTVKRPDKCENCGGSDGIIEAHHDDYSKQLEVAWLCHKCHANLHADQRREAS